MGTENDDLSSKLMNDMDPRLLEFLQTSLDSLVKWDLVRFFHENPHTTDTAENIARYAGRDVNTIENELIELAESGVLVMQEVAGLRVFTLTTDEEMREIISLFVRSCDDRQFRIKALYHVIRKMR